MASDTCDGCGEQVTIAGGIANLWTLDADATGGVTLEFDSDGTEHFLCFGCVDRLPDDPTAEDVAALADEDEGFDVLADEEGDTSEGMEQTRQEMREGFEEDIEEMGDDG